MAIFNIGELGVVHEDVELSFTYFGATIRVSNSAGELSYFEFMASAMKLDENDQVKSMPLLESFLKDQIHSDDWETFWALAKKHRQSMEDLMAVSNAILEAVAGFPTGESSDSPPTPQKTQPKSKGASSSRGTSRARAPRAKPTKKTAMEILKGRPDLQTAVVHARGARSAG